MSARSSASSGDSGAGLSTTHAAGEQGGHQLGGDEKLRHVPGHDRGDHTDRLVPDVEVGAEEAGANLLPRIAFRRDRRTPIIIRGSPTWARWANVMGAPSSVLIALGHLGFAFAVELRQVRRMAAIRSDGATRGHGPSSKAVRAAATAASTSAGPAAGTCDDRLLVCGEVTSITWFSACCRPRTADEQFVVVTFI